MRGECGRRLERAILAEQPGVLTEVGIKRGDFRQIGVKRVAQRRRADDGIQVADGTPCSIQAIEPVGEGCHDAVPCRRMRISGHGLDCGARVRQQLVDRGCHMRGFDGVKPRQAGKFEQRI